MASLTFRTQVDIQSTYPRTPNCIDDIALPQIHSWGTDPNTSTDRTERRDLEPQVNVARRDGITGSWWEKSVGQLWN